MQTKIYLFLSQYILFCSQYGFINMKPMFGQNVRIAQVDEFPFVVSLIQIHNFNDLDVTHLCTGTLLTSNDVATAASCMEDVSLPIQVTVGTVNYFLGIRHQIYWWLTYEQWAVIHHVEVTDTDNDIVILRLLLHVHDDIHLIELSTYPNNRLYGKEVTTAGWSIAQNGSIVEPLLKTVTVNVLSTRICMNRVESILQYRHFINSRQSICTSSLPPSLLHDGDRGGPLLYRNKLIGINKGIMPENQYNNPNVVNIHMSINYYRRFFLAMMECADA